MQPVSLYSAGCKKSLFLSVPPPPLLCGVSALSPSIDLPPFMSCLMKRGSKKEICPSEMRMDRCDVFTSNEAARPHFSGSQAVGSPQDTGDHQERSGAQGGGRRRVLLKCQRRKNGEPVIVAKHILEAKICIQASQLDKVKVTHSQSFFLSSDGVSSQRAEALQNAAGIFFSFFWWGGGLKTRK